VRPPASPPLAGPARGWLVERVAGTAAALHRASAALLDAGSDGIPPARRVRVLDAERPAVVLGSAQPTSDVDLAHAARRGLDVAHRRSGGSAVLVGPGEVIWVDVVIPRGDPLWDADVARAMHWVGEWWADALVQAEVCPAAGPGQPLVWRGRYRKGRWADRVCFAGLGPGEVVAAVAPAGPGVPQGPDPVESALLPGPKLVGIAQRRTRVGALFQCAVLLRWRPADLLFVLALTEAQRREAAGELAPVAAGIGPGRAGELLDAFLARLPAPPAGAAPGAQRRKGEGAGLPGAGSDLP